MANVIEIEPDTAGNNSLHFMPIGKTIRGRFDYARDSEPQAALLKNAFGGVVPGQRLGIDLDAGEGYVVEPLHEAQHKGVRAVIERKGLALAAERQTFSLPSKDDHATWVYWFKRAVESGLAKLVKGRIPDKLDGTPRKQFITTERKPDAKDATIARLTALLVAKLSPAERKAFEEAGAV
jgi:hypothetical protein